LLEKPPGATVCEVEQLRDLADRYGVSLYATWHSRHGVAVATAKALLKESHLKSATLTWKEDVKKWHPGQEWIWQAGGLGVFDPGINGLSILTECLSEAAFVTKANLVFPANKAAPIAAQLDFVTQSDANIHADFDWRQCDGEAWSIDFDTDKGLLSVLDGGAALQLNDEVIELSEHSEFGEYQAIYQNFAKLIKQRKSDVDLTPLKLVADAFLLGSRETTEPFHDHE